MLPVVVVDFDAGASHDQQQAVLAACNRVLQTTECVAGGADDARPTRAIAQVSWVSASQVHLELGLRSTERWTEHEIVFSHNEPPAERWRTIGFSIATLVGEEATPQSAESSDPRNDSANPQDAKKTAPKPAVANGGVRFAPRVGVGVDRPTTLGGVEVQGWASPFLHWTPVLGAAYSVPLHPQIDVHWSELELGAGAGLRQKAGPTELRLGLLFTLTRIAVRDDSNALAAWVPGGQLAGELRWPTHRFWTIATRVSAQLNDGATGIAQGGQGLASSPGWLVGASSGLELQF